jgi:hypothetical protein
MIIRYGDRLDVRASAFDVARLYRDHRDERMRHLAAVACLHLNDDWAVGYLRMSEPFERSARVLHSIRALLAEADAEEGARSKLGKGIAETGELRVIVQEKGR